MWQNSSEIKNIEYIYKILFKKYFLLEQIDIFDISDWKKYKISKKLEYCLKKQIKNFLI